MLSNLKFRYSFISFLCLLTVLTLEAPALGSYSKENKTFPKEELNFLWRNDKAGFTTFLNRAENRLPKYKDIFKEAAKEINVPWMLLAAISYQESHWNPRAISNTGVRGMMMLTQKTAKEMGIKKRTDVQDSILGGAHYFHKTMNKLPSDIPKLDKISMSLAAYNLGFKNIELARELAKSSNLNSNLWSDVSISLKEVLIDRYGKESIEFVKHDQVLHYVENINLYYATLSIINKEEELILLAQK